MEYRKSDNTLQGATRRRGTEWRAHCLPAAYCLATATAVACSVEANRWSYHCNAQILVSTPCDAGFKHPRSMSGKNLL